jgi:hypothetical protein
MAYLLIDDRNKVTIPTTFCSMAAFLLARDRQIPLQRGSGDPLQANLALSNCLPQVTGTFAKHPWSEAEGAAVPVT